MSPSKTELGSVIVVVSTGSKYNGAYGYIYRCFPSGFIGVVVADGRKTKYTKAGVMAVKRAVRTEDEGEFQAARDARNRHFRSQLSAEIQDEVAASYGGEVTEKEVDKEKPHIIPDPQSSSSFQTSQRVETMILGLQEQVQRIAEALKEVHVGTQSDLANIRQYIGNVEARLACIENKPPSVGHDMSESESIQGSLH